MTPLPQLRSPSAPPRRGASWFSALHTVARLAFRNLGRNKKRTALALASIAIAQFFVLVVDGFMAGYNDVMRNIMTGPLLGHVQVHAPEFTEKRSMDLLLTRAEDKIRLLQEHADVTTVFPRVYAPSLAAKSEVGFVSVVIGVDPEAEALAGGFLDPAGAQTESGTLGLKSQPGTKPRSDAEGTELKKSAIVGAALARRQGLKVGDELALMGQTADGAMAADLITIRGIVSSTVELINAQGILIQLDAAQEIYALGDRVHELTIRGKSPDAAEELAKQVQEIAAFKKTEVLPWQKGAPELLQMTEMMDSFTWLILGFVFIAAAAGIANTMVMSAFERTREMGVLLALGATPNRVAWMLILETIWLGALGLLLGTVLGSTTTSWLGEVGVSMADLAGSSEEIGDLSFQGVSFNMTVYSRMRPDVLVQSLVAMGITCFLAVLWPIQLVLRLQPTEAMRR